MRIKDPKTKLGFRTRIIHNIKFTIVGCKTFIEPLQDYLVAKLGFNKTKLNIRHKDEEMIVTLEYSGRGNMKKFYDFIYNNASIFLKRKKTKFESIICALDEKSSSETGLIAGTPEMVISSQVSKLEKGSSTIPEMEVESSDSKCPALSK